MKRFYLALDLDEDPNMIAQYEQCHRQVWPEIKKSIVDSDILQMEILRTRNRLFVVMETEDSFSMQHNADLYAVNARVQEWEELMWKFQRPLPWAKRVSNRFCWRRSSSLMPMIGYRYSKMDGVSNSNQSSVSIRGAFSK